MHFKELKRNKRNLRSHVSLIRFLLTAADGQIVQLKGILMNYEELSSSEVRPIDQVRASLLILADLTEDREMWAATMWEIHHDPWGFNGMGSTINVFRIYSDTLAVDLDQRYGREKACELLRRTIIDNTEAAESDA